MNIIIDTPNIVTSKAVALKYAGVSTVIRYFNPIGPYGDKNVQLAEIRAICAAGMTCAIVSEGWGDFAHGGISAGAGDRDGEFSAGEARDMGIPAGAAIYFAVDTDATQQQIYGLVGPYFAAAKAYIEKAGYRIGAYGSGDVLAFLQARSLVSLTWLACSTGWSGSRAYAAGGKWALKQHLPSIFAGLDVDTNDAQGDFGAFTLAPSPAMVNQATGNQSSIVAMMTASPDQITAGTNALKNYVDRMLESMWLGWAEGMVPSDLLTQAATATIVAALNVSQAMIVDQVNHAIAALKQVLMTSKFAGYASRMTPDEFYGAAVTTLRGAGIKTS